MEILVRMASGSKCVRILSNVDSGSDKLSDSDICVTCYNSVTDRQFGAILRIIFQYLLTYLRS
jgi:hypothetical protein